MMRQAITKVARAAGRGLQTTRVSRINAASNIGAVTVVARPVVAAFISTSADRKGITPDDAPPRPKPDTPEAVKTPAEITESGYHMVADEYLDRLVTHLEDLQDQREDIDVEYSAGVLTVNFGPEIGTYVINKQPPNKQIWLSSPKTGPKRYDYVVLGESQNDKQDTAAGEWMYLRDNSTIHQLFLEELGIDLSMPTGHYGG
ncbi:hypothetical protein B0H66DRAFT_502391 [Apodospora peruviana]|uniref:ferroxidase n=1 Tax=Apodospora peruviana TaxID=516989 RepID=A0AAE0M1F6_9PEZI|nr:hypothetical protein B0H66DRAFT_502391 [Apodospora peruviana]